MQRMPKWKRKMLYAQHRRAGRLNRAKRLGEERAALNDRLDADAAYTRLVERTDACVDAD